MLRQRKCWTRNNRSCTSSPFLISYSWEGEIDVVDHVSRVLNVRINIAWVSNLLLLIPIIFISRFTKQILHLILQTEKWDEDSIKTTTSWRLERQFFLKERKGCFHKEQRMYYQKLVRKCIRFPKQLLAIAFPDHQRIYLMTLQWTDASINGDFFFFPGSVCGKR